MIGPPKGTVRDWLDARAEGLESDRVAFQFFDDPVPALTWCELRQRARDTALELTASGVGKGRSIAIMMPNGSAGVISVFAALYGGFRATVLNLAAGDDALTYALDHSEAKVALVGAAQAEQFNRCSAGIQIPSFESGSQSDALHDVVADDDALLMYTSGTTGRPKGVVHSHASLLAGGWTTTVAHQLSDQDVGLCVLPICHINGLCVTVMGGLISGGTIAMAPKFSSTQFWAQMSSSHATWFSVVPTIISHLLHADATPDATTSKRVRFGRSASSALSPDVHEAFEAKFGIRLIETMGLTETAAQILSNPLPPGVQKIGSPGIAYGNEICILSAELIPMAPMQQGEIAVRGPNVMREYLKNAEATRGTFTSDGWLRTGDLGHMDDDGYVFVTGRLKELIIKGGENIAPREIDDALYSHEDVIEAAAFGRPCKIYGEKIEAAVVLRKGSALTEIDLIGLCKSRLGTFKSPDVVHFLDALPKGPSGKIQRKNVAIETL